MRDVDHHSHSIHLTNDALSKFIEPARPADVIARRTRPGRANAPCRRHVAHAQIVIALNVLQPFINRITAFETKQGCDLSFTHGAPDIIG